VRLIEAFYVHTVSVQTFTGSGGMGDTYESPVILSPETDTGVLVDDTRKLVRSSTGAEVISETAIYGRPALASVLTEGSLVTLPSGRVATVITLAVRDSAGLDLPDHVEAACT
jgi:hypothetical protein